MVNCIGIIYSLYSGVFKLFTLNCFFCILCRADLANVSSLSAALPRDVSPSVVAVPVGVAVCLGWRLQSFRTLYPGLLAFTRSTESLGAILMELPLCVTWTFSLAASNILSLLLGNFFFFLILYVWCSLCLSSLD